MTRTRFAQLFLGLAIFVLVGCQADVELELRVAENGSGVVLLNVTFDDEAIAALGDVASQLRVEDLERSGWTIETAPGQENGLTLTASKDVADASQWQGVLDEIAGPGVFTNVEVTLDDGYATARQELSYDLDVSDGWSLLADDGIADTITGGQAIDDVVSVKVISTLFADGDNPAVSSTTAPRFDGDVAEVRSSATRETGAAVLLRWIAIALFSLFVLATALAITGIVLQRRSDRLRPLPTPASLASRVPGSRAAAGAAAAAVTAAPTESAVRLVVVDSLSVLYGETRPFDESLLPFIREHHGDVRADEIEADYHDVVAGTIDTSEFWDRCGVELTTPVDGAYMRTRQLQAGAADFLKEMQRRRIPIAAVSHDVAEWSHDSRERDRLRSVWPWLVSSEVGVEKSNPAMFEILRRESGIAYGHCLYVDADLATLDIAKDLGMKTALFDTGNLDLPQVVGHPVVNDFKALIG